MSRRTLTTRRLNRALLARQHLLNRSRSPITNVLRSVAGLQTQYAPSGYVGLWSRCQLRGRSSVTTSLERRHIVQATLMRSTIHLVAAGDFPLFSAGVRSARREWWTRIARARGLDHLDLPAAAAVVRSALERRPHRRAELVEALASAGFPPEIWEGVGLWIDMVRVPPSGTWERRRADIYALADQWIDRPEPSEQQGLAHLVTSYLGGFGPASFSDISSWSGVPAPRLADASALIAFRHFQSTEGEDLVDLPRAPLPPETTDAPVRFLPTWDATLLVHARRSQVLQEVHRPAIFHTKNPHSIGTFLIDGTVAGTWRFEESSVRVTPFERLKAEQRRAVRIEADRLAAFHLE